MFKNHILRYQYSDGGSSISQTTTNISSPTSSINVDLSGRPWNIYDLVTGDYDTNDTLSLDINSKTIDKKFGRSEDYIELHIYNINNQLIYSEDNFKDFTKSNESISSNIQVDPNKILTDRGFVTGNFRLKLNILKNKVFNTIDYPFIIKEISNNRRETKSVSPKTLNSTIDIAVSNFISDIESSTYFKEFSINLGNDILIPCINILLNKGPLKHEVLIKTLDPLPYSISPKTSFKIVEEITDPISIDVNLGPPKLISDDIPLRGPNFHIDIRQNNSVPSGFKNYDELLQYSVTSSYQHLLSKIEKTGLEVDIRYDHIRTVSESTEGIDIPYHFDNFVHFSNAVERLKNFKYKLKLIELYDSQLSNIDSITGGTTSSYYVITDKSNINLKKEKLIKGFDGYEQFLYFESGTFSWPKQNSSSPYTLYSITASEAKTWMGSENSADMTYYGGQLLSASLYDKQNNYSLVRTLPTHILENTNNNLYISFINMIGQHFDSVWTHIKAITELHDASNSTGVSKDLVYYQLKSLGIETFDQFENANLIEYILGEGTGSNQYDVTNFYSSSGVPSETIVTASNAGSIPKQDISKKIWKRLYHNAPYLLKTKGTERGIRALMSCYGIPSTILNIKEYGGSSPVSGPLKDLNIADTYKTFTYEKSGLALHGDSGITTGYFAKTNWSSSTTDNLSASAKTVEFRIKPVRSDAAYHLFSLSGSDATKDPHLVLTPHTGNDISSSDDSNQYGQLDLYINDTITTSTEKFPIYNGDFWNIHIGTLGTSGSTADIQFGAYQTNFNKNITSHITQSSQTEADRQLTFGDPFNGGNNIGGAMHAYFGGVPSNGASAYDTVDTLRYSGSFQEIRYYFGELLSDSTFKKHSLEPFMYAGNSVSSSYDYLVLRLPLGSNDKQNSSSFHPDIDTDYLGVAEGISSSISSLKWEEVIENHYLPTPDTVGISMTSEKVRIDEGTISENILSPFNKLETSTLDRQPQDFEDLGIFFSPTNEINEDIIYTLGSFRLDDYIGSPLPSEQTASIYKDLKDIKDVYFKKVKRRYNYGDYIKQIQYMDHTLFKVIEQFVPFKANTKTGLVIEPHFLERSKFKRTLPVRSDAQTAIPGTHQNIETDLNLTYYSGSIYTLEDSSVVSIGNLSTTTSSRGKRIDKGTNGTITIYDDYLDPSQKDVNRENNQACQSPIVPYLTTKPFNYISHESSVILGNTITGRKSNKYYKYKEYYLTSSSLY
jgi:hypothetical protein